MSKGPVKLIQRVKMAYLFLAIRVSQNNLITRAK